MLRMAPVLTLLPALWLPALAQPPQASAQKGAEKRLYVVTYIDVLPQFAADTTKFLLQFAADSRKDAGSVRFEVFQDTVRSNHFTLVEVWQNRQAYDAHLEVPHTRQFREKLQPGLGGPWDQRMYYLIE